MKRLSPALLVVLAASCHRAPPAQVEPAAAPPIPMEALSAPPAQTTAPSAVAGPSDTTNEPRISLHATDADVRPLLRAIAARGGYSLVLPINLDRKVSIELNDTPVSVALQTVLAAAGLQLESTTDTTARPSTRPVVFYELPANVDSLSVDAIMKRFGVGRTIAEMIVSSRQRP